MIIIKNSELIPENFWQTVGCAGLAFVKATAMIYWKNALRLPFRIFDIAQ